MSLQQSDLEPNPLSRFRQWLEAAVTAQLPEPYAMSLATATANGKPSARMVVLRAFDERGFVFFTDYSSRKAQELAENPLASLVLYWAGLQRQVRVEGRVEMISNRDADEFFAARPRDYQLAAWACKQNEFVSGHPALEKRLQEMAQQFQDQEIPRPAHWGGYRVIADRFEFWQARANRLHDRFSYTRHADGHWLIQQLSP